MNDRGQSGLVLKVERQEPLLQRLWDSRTDVVLGVIFLTITGLYVLLMVRDRVPKIGLVVLGCLWLLYLVLGRRLTFATPVDLPMLGLGGLLALSLFISVDWTYSLPKAYGLLLGIALFYLVVNFIRSYNRLYLAMGGLILLVVGTVFLGVLSADWSQSAFPFPGQIQNLILDLLPFSSRPGDVGSTNLNTIGGALAFFPPLLLSLIWDGGGFYRKYLQDKPNQKKLRTGYKLSLALLFVVVLGMILVTGSRGAYLGTLIGLTGLAVWKDRCWLWLIPIGLVALVAVLFILADGDIQAFITLLDTDVETSTFPRRIEAWRNAIYAIQDFPLTGAGIFTYGRVIGEFYTASLFPDQNVPLLHAHNLYLSVAYDLGIPGLVLYMALLGAAGAMVWRSLKTSRSVVRALLMGLTCGLLAYHGFGLMDTNTLGTKLGAILWIFLGLIAAVYVHRDNFSWQVGFSSQDEAAHQVTRPSLARINRRIKNLFVDLLYWLMISLAAVSIVNYSVIASIIAAAVGGLLMGMRMVIQYRKRRKSAI